MSASEFHNHELAYKYCTSYSHELIRWPLQLAVLWFLYNLAAVPLGHSIGPHLSRNCDHTLDYSLY